MMTTRIGSYLIGLGLFSAVDAERPSALRAQYTDAASRWHAHLQQVERATRDEARSSSRGLRPAVAAAGVEADVMKKPWWTAVFIVALLTVIGGWAARASLIEAVVVPADTTPAWVQRLSLVDEAVASNDVSRAIYKWREAYGAALGSRRSEALASVGDAALRIDTIAGSRAVFREEARDAYHGSMLLAHAQRDARTMMRAADSLAQLGDTRAAERARHMVQGWARHQAP